MREKRYGDAHSVTCICGQRGFKYNEIGRAKETFSVVSSGLLSVRAAANGVIGYLGSERVSGTREAYGHA